MWRLILITFAVLGWSFYEISGGSDYEPRAGSLQAEAYTVFRPPHVSQTETIAARTPAAEPVAEVSRASVDLTILPGVTTALPRLGAPADPAPATEKIVVLNAAAPVVLTNAAITAPLVSPLQKDIREISGSVVNLRMGPGTKHGIITKLRLGEVVEVLGDPGGGWLKLRVVETGRVGWMSDTLVTAAAE